MEDGFLPVPRAYFRGPLYDHPAGWGRVYVDFQQRAAWARRADQRAGPALVALERGELIFAGEREEAARYAIHRNTLRALLEYLEGHQLVAWPEGRRHRRPVRLRLLDYWPDRLTGAQEPGPYDGPNDAPKTGPEKPAPRLDPQHGARPKPDRSAGRARDRLNGKDREETGELLPPSAGGAGPELREDHPEHPTHRLMRLLVEVGYSGWQLTGSLYAEQAAVVKRMHQRHGPEQVELALGRMRNLFPWSQEHRPPFSAFDLEKQFSKALATVQAPPQRHPGAAARGPGEFDVGQDMREREQRGRQLGERERSKVEAFRVRLDDWRRDARAALMAQPDDVQQQYAKQAREFYERLAFTQSRTPEERQRLREDMALKLYGDAHGLPMPVP